MSGRRRLTHLQGTLNIGFFRSTWFNAPPPRRRTQEPVPITVELHYSILPPETLGKECIAGRAQGTKAGGQEGDMQRIGTVTLFSGDNKAPRNRLRLDGDVEILAPPIPVKQGQTVGFQVLMNSAATTEQFTLRQDKIHAHSCIKVASLVLMFLISNVKVI